MSERDHSNCGPGCLWCALQKALASRQGHRGTVELAGSQSSESDITPRQAMHDIDQLCNFLGDVIASTPSDEAHDELCRLVSVWLSSRIAESRARNMQHPLWRAQHEAANGGGEHA